LANIKRFLYANKAEANRRTRAHQKSVVVTRTGSQGERIGSNVILQSTSKVPQRVMSGIDFLKYPLRLCLVVEKSNRKYMTTKCFSVICTVLFYAVDMMVQKPGGFLECSSLNSHFVITFHLQGINWFVFYLDGATMEVCEQTHERTGLKQSPSLLNTNHAKLVLFHMESSIYVCMCVCVRDGGREGGREGRKR
jgi:hypothetical protein